MKRILTIFIIAAFSTLLIGCSNPVANQETYQVETTVSKPIALTPDNFSEFFFSDVYGNIDAKTSALGTTYFVNTVHVSFDLNQTASIKNVTVKGKIYLNVAKSHLLYVEGKLPLDFSVNINATGHGEIDLYYQHGTGSYGGYGAKDFYITIESVTGYVSPAHPNE
ncbi:MAG: hypothetical protein K6F14_03290 [Clostridiales bacterium]|nr:hypothetical protein [Clostridiales bacterium]